MAMTMFLIFASAISRVKVSTVHNLEPGEYFSRVGRVWDVKKSIDACSLCGVDLVGRKESGETSKSVFLAGARAIRCGPCMMRNRLIGPLRCLAVTSS